jgi:hypothetical protein
MEILDKLVAKWEDRLRNYTAYKKTEFATELKLCLSDVKSYMSAETTKYQPATLDSVCHFNKHKGKKWKDVIEQFPDYADWCLANVTGFQLDEDAHKYLVEIQQQEDLRF